MATSRPIVTVTQSVANIVTSINEPEQKVVLVGPKYDVLKYDPSAEDRSSSVVVSDYSPFTGANLADINFATAPEYELPGSAAVDTTLSTPKFYFEDASFAVVYGQDGLGSTDASSSNDVSELHFGNRAVNWSAKKMHVDSPFTAAAGDRLHIGHTVASKFTYNADTLDQFDAAALEDLINKDEPKLVDRASGDAGQVVHLIYHDPVNKGIYLAGDDLLLAPDGEATLLKIGNGDYIAGTLSIPEEQSFIIKGITGGAVSVAGPIHSYVKNGTVKALHYRIDRKISASNAFRPSVTSVEINNLDDINDEENIFTAAWDATNSVNELTLSNAPDLRDTSITGIKTTLSADCRHHVITGGTLHSTMRMLSTSGSASVLQVSASTASTLVGGAGSAVPENPLGFAAAVALANSGGSTIGILSLESNDSAGYAKALSVINADPDVYATVPLSTDLSNVILPYRDAAIASSKPSKGRFRIVIGASAPCPTKEYLAGTPSSVATGTLVKSNADKYILIDPEAAFIANGVSTTDTVTIGVDTFTVQSVLAENQLMLEHANLGAHAGAVDYTCTRDISTNRDAQVTLLSNTIASASDKRLVMLYPGTCTIGGYTNQPGFYLAAAVGGMVGQFEPHRPKNQIGLAGIDALETSNLGFFTEDQIDSLSEAGYFVLIQDTAGSAPYCVHQVTTAAKDYMGTQEWSELSVLNNFDFVSRTFKNSLTPFVGTWNVIPQAISSIGTTLDAVALNLRSKRSDVIGAPLLSMTVDSLEISESDAGTIIIKLSIRIPRVLNRIELELISE